jgi:hypothetical protein
VLTLLFFFFLPSHFLSLAAQKLGGGKKRDGSKTAATSTPLCAQRRNLAVRSFSISASHHDGADIVVATALLVIVARALC